MGHMLRVLLSPRRRRKASCETGKRSHDPIDAVRLEKRGPRGDSQLNGPTAISTSYGTPRGVGSRNNHESLFFETGRYQTPVPLPADWSAATANYSPESRRQGIPGNE